jgi:UDP-N-acetylglucosamine diphosphorylase / glucose-1-phosphate thymidylyltransferase / UDP-N-acetylgalactosamine diphosphorylase / glucosamine-1-phosphate N-acetyltransferase / galactosamine-1-phosphate N-acetyltransferase
MIAITQYVSSFTRVFPSHVLKSPWTITQRVEEIVLEKIKSCGPDFNINGNLAIHKTAKIEEGVVLKGPMIISENCFIAAHAYLRAGVFCDRNVIIGPGCEVKSTIILEKSTLAHFNFAGDSIIGSNVNMEAGSIVANHHNDREDKNIFVLIDGKATAIGSQKFGALIGDHCKIGANAVLSPGTILQPKSVVGRLALINQCP